MRKTLILASMLIVCLCTNCANKDSSVRGPLPDGFDYFDGEFFSPRNDMEESLMNSFSRIHSCMENWKFDSLLQFMYPEMVNQFGLPEKYKCDTENKMFEINRLTKEYEEEYGVKFECHIDTIYGMEQRGDTVLAPYKFTHYITGETMNGDTATLRWFETEAIAIAISLNKGVRWYHQPHDDADKLKDFFDEQLINETLTLIK